MAQPEVHAIKVTTPHCLGGGRGDVAEGAVLTVPDDVTPAEAKRKIAMNFAVAVTGGEQSSDGPAPEGEPAGVGTRDPGLDSRDPAIGRTAKAPRARKPKKKAKPRR